MNQKHSSYMSRICFFYLVPLTMIALSKAFGSGGLTIWSFVGGMQVGAGMLFAMRALMLTAEGAGGAFLFNGLVAATGSIFSWIGFTTKLLCNLLLMSSTKLCNVWIGWASFEGEEGAGPNYQGTQHNQKQEMNWLGCFVLNKISNIGKAVLLVGPSLPPKRGLYFGLRPATFQKWYSLHQQIFFAMKWSPMSLIILSLSLSGEQGWRKGHTVSGSLLHSLPLQKKWTQTLSGKSQGKISLFLIFGLCNKNMPISKWVHFTVSFTTALHSFFLAFNWGWLCSTFGCHGVVLISSRSAVSGLALVGGISS
jgi:hypothetical protein